MSYYERTRKDARPRRQTSQARNWAAAKPLSNDQKARLCILAKAVWEIHRNAGLCDESESEFRRSQVEVAVGKNGLTACSNADFRAVEAHFLKLKGATAEAAAVWAKTGRVKGSTERHDTHENRELALHQLMQAVRVSDGQITDAYIAEIARDMYSGAAVHQLTSSQLQGLVFTVIARLRKMRPDLSL